MRTAPIVGSLFLMTALLLGTTLTGCSKNEPKKDTNPPPVNDKGKGGDQPKADTGGKKEPLTAKTDGTIKGSVKIDGPKPAEESLVKAMQEHADKDVCLAGSEDEKVKQIWLVNKDGGVKDVVVFLQPPAGKSFAVTDEMKKNFEKPAVLDQPHCAFVPHVVALYPAGGQTLLVKNSAPVTHNTKIEGNPRANPASNVTLQSGKDESIKLAYQKTPLSVSCNVHPWMNAKVLTLNEPYFAVTKGDGSFEIPNVPSGVELSVMMWHDSMSNPLEVQKITPKTGDNDLSLKIKSSEAK